MAKLFPDSEGGWICDIHKKERGSQKYGSNCYRCLQAENERLRDEIKQHIAAKRELAKSLQKAWNNITQMKGLLETLEEIRLNSDPNNLQELETVADCKAVMKFLYKKAGKAITFYRKKK